MLEASRATWTPSVQGPNVLIGQDWGACLEPFGLRVGDKVTSGPETVQIV